MHIPIGLAPLLDDGILDEVVRPLMSGKEAQVYLVRSKGQLCVAKVYKEALLRTFKQRAEYTEGRKVRNTRDQRAIDKRTRHGRAEDEAAWRSTEVDVIRRLHAEGVRVPVPYHFVEGVLVMELIADAEGNPAPRISDLHFEPDEARVMYDRLIREVVRMLSAGLVHGDFSCFNVLAGADGPVIIDFPQSVDTAHNANARKLLLRDVENIHEFLRRFVPGARRVPYAEEMWDLHQRNMLTPETVLGARFRGAHAVGAVNVSGVLGLIQDANHDEQRRREVLGSRGGPRERHAATSARQGDATPGERRPAPTASQPQRQPRPDSRHADAQHRAPRRGDPSPVPSRPAQPVPVGDAPRRRAYDDTGRRPGPEVIVMHRRRPS